MDWQQIVALSIVALTLGIMAGRWLGRRRRRWGQTATCCGATRSAPGRETTVYQARKGKRPRIILRP